MLQLYFDSYKSYIYIYIYIYICILRSYALALYLLVYKRSLVTPIGRLSRKRRIVSTTWSWSMCGYRPTTLNETNTAFSDVSPIRFKPCKKFLMSSKICGVVEVFKVEI